MSGKKKQAYEVGYKKPPIATRFKKGKSGNPSGRPKRVPIIDPGLLLEAIDNEEIIVTENGKRKRMPKVEIEFRQLFTKALKGDLRAARHVFEMATEYLAPEIRTSGEYEFICVSQAAKRFGRKWPDRIRELNMSRGYL
jgi:hypothetical protein